MKNFFSEESNSNWFLFIFRNSKYQFPGMVSSVITISGISFLAVWLHDRYEVLSVHVPSSFHTVLGLVVGLLLVFRTNTAYDRWWEGRKQLGQILNSCRNLAIGFEAYLDQEPNTKKAEIKQLIIAYFWSLKNHLREKDYSALSEQLPENYHADFQRFEHKPNFVLLCINRHIVRLVKEKTISPEQQMLLETTLKNLTDSLGACERIRNTPMPMGYALHLKRILLIYIVTLPLSFIDILHWWSIPVVILIFYIMAGIEKIGEEIEDPFGTDPNDLPVDELEQKLIRNVNAIMAS